MTFNSTDLIRASARLNYSIGGPDLVNVMYFQMVSPSSLADALVVSDIGQVLELIYGPVVATLNSSVQFTDYTVKNETQDAAPIVAGWPTLTVGGSAIDALPSQVVGLITARTNKSRKQGRVNVSGMAETLVNGNTWIGGGLTNLVSMAAQLLLLHVATNGNYRYGVASQAVLPPRDIVNSWDQPISSAVIAFVRTQRRRSQGFGS